MESSGSPHGFRGSHLCCVGLKRVHVHRRADTQTHCAHLDERAAFRKWQHFEDSISCFWACSTYWGSDCGSIRPLVFITEGKRGGNGAHNNTLQLSWPHDPGCFSVGFWSLTLGGLSLGVVPRFCHALSHARGLGAAMVKILTGVAKPTKNVLKEKKGARERRTLEIPHYIIIVMVITQTKRARAIPIHCPGINASVYFLTLFSIIENVFQAAHVFADCGELGKERMSEAFFLICCTWRNMPKHATLNHPLTLP